MANSVPTLAGLDSPAFPENAINATPQPIDGDVTFIERDGQFAGGAVTVTGPRRKQEETCHRYHVVRWDPPARRLRSLA